MRGVVPIHNIRPKHLARLVKRAIVEIDDAEVLAHGLLPMRFFGQLPLEGVMWFEYFLIRGDSGLVHLLKVEVSELVVIGSRWLFDGWRSVGSCARVVDSGCRRRMLRTLRLGSSEVGNPKMSACFDG